jgi:frataxin-like iron-binding protein CyaY
MAFYATPGVGHPILRENEAQQIVTQTQSAARQSYLRRAVSGDAFRVGNHELPTSSQYHEEMVDILAQMMTSEDLEHVETEKLGPDMPPPSGSPV